MKTIPVTAPVAPADMDMMLAHGYYRMQQTFFTAHVVQKDDGLPAKVVWARICLRNFCANARLKRLQKLNRGLSLTACDARITDEVEDLYARYRASVDFDGWPSVSMCLLGNAARDFFPGRMWEVRWCGQLVGAGYFDEGITSSAGILNFYDPRFSRHSLGLWMFLEAVRHAAESGKRYFYPGYLVMGMPKFDYKLLAGRHRTELFEPFYDSWLPFEQTILAEKVF